MRIYWVERIDFWVALHLVVCQLRYRQPAQAYCREPRVVSSIWRALLAAAGIAQIEKIARALGEMTNERGVNLYWHNDELMLAATELSFAGLDIARNAARAHENSNLFQVFLTRAALADLHQETLRATALWGNSSTIDSNDQHLILPDSLFFEALADSYRRPGLTVSRYWRPFQLPRLIREYLAAARHALRAFQPSLESSSPRGPVIAVQYVAGFARDQINDIPWFEASGLRPDQILIYSEGSKGPDAAREAGVLGFQFVDLSAWQPTKERRRFLWDVGRALSTSLRVMITASGPWSRRIWLGFWIARFLRREALFHSFFIEHKIKIHLHVGDADTLALAATAALRKLDGLDFAFQLGGSSIELAFEYRALTDRVLFAWGNYHRDMNVAIGRRVPGKEPRKILVIGHPHDHLIELHRDAAESVRRKMQANGFRYLIVGFDNVSRDDFLISPSHVTELYRGLVEIACADPSVAILVKPKIGSAVALPPESTDRLADLVGRGQWVELPSQTTVFEASLCADLVIALHMNTAAMEAAIAGIPHIYYDLTAWLDHPFYRLRDRLIATNPDELRRMVAQHRHGQGFDRQGPEFWRYKNALSPFGDYQSARRMGNAIRAAFDALAAGRPSEQVVNELMGGSSFKRTV